MAAPTREVIASKGSNVWVPQRVSKTGNRKAVSTAPTLPAAAATPAPRPRSRVGNTSPASR